MLLVESVGITKRKHSKAPISYIIKTWPQLFFIKKKSSAKLHCDFFHRNPY